MSTSHDISITLIGHQTLLIGGVLSARWMCYLSRIQAAECHAYQNHENSGRLATLAACHAPSSYRGVVSSGQASLLPIESMPFKYKALLVCPVSLEFYSDRGAHSDWLEQA